MIINLKSNEINLTNLHFENIGIFCEVSIIRDAFHNSKPFVNEFMDKLTELIIQQENKKNCRLYSELPKILNDIEKTHPKQIRHKATSKGIQLNEEESQIYDAMQSIFNVKPDLIITIDNKLLVFEAKFTEAFDEIQINRTKKITEIWAKLLFKDLGFIEQPEYAVFKLGASKFSPHLNWSHIFEIANKTYNKNDRSFIAFEAALDLLKRNKLE